MLKVLRDVSVIIPNHTQKDVQRLDEQLSKLPNPHPHCNKAHVSLNASMTSILALIPGVCPDDVHITGHKAQDSDLQLARTLFIIALVFVICWSPYAICVLIDPYDKVSAPRNIRLFVAIECQITKVWHSDGCP